MSKDNGPISIRMKATKNGFPDGIEEVYYRKGEIYTFSKPGGINVAEQFLEAGVAVRVKLTPKGEVEEVEAPAEEEEAPEQEATGADEGEQEAEEEAAGEPGELIGTTPRAGRRRS